MAAADPSADRSADPSAHDEVILGLTRLIEQAQDESNAATSRIVAVIAARNYLEALTRRLVNEAREAGSTWEELGHLFGTSAVNAKARYGDYNDYGD
jgi:hypothetical protein